MVKRCYNFTEVKRKAIFPILAPQEAMGVNPWRNGEKFPKGYNPDVTSVSRGAGFTASHGIYLHTAIIFLPLPYRIPVI